MNASSPLREGFACQWNRNDPARTWSGTPYALKQAMLENRSADIVDVPINPPRWAVNALYLAGMRRRHHAWLPVSPWWTSMATLRHRAMQRALAQAGRVDAVLSIGEHGILPVPQFVYQDMAINMLLDPRMAAAFDAIPDLPSAGAIRRRAAMERTTYETLAGVFSMSEWNANATRAIGVIAPERVHAVGAGINVPAVVRSQDDVHRLWELPTRTVLFIGRHFLRKGGDLVVEAVRLLRNGSDMDVRLAIMGPESLPAGIGREPWMDLYGDAPHDVVRTALATAHVLALPSRFEAYGIAILEALASGIPVVGRNAFAMPEMIVPGVNGALIDRDDPLELAEALDGLLRDPAVAASTVETAPDLTERHRWTNVAARMTTIMAESLR